MKFNNEEIGIEKLVKPYRNNPKLKENDIINVLYNDEHVPVPGCKVLKKGKYKVLKIREPFATKFGLVYELISTRLNATYIHPIYTENIDYAIDKGYIMKVEQ